MKREKVIKSITAAVGLLPFVMSTDVAKAEINENDSVPFNLTLSIPCANNGAGEDVILTGYLHALISVTANKAGGFHVKTHFQPQGVKGIGLITGDSYNATGVTQDEFNVAAGYEETFVNNFRIIGQKSGNNFLVHEVIHITINANGVVTASIDNFSADCK